jgi:hypothetical protein
MNPYESPKTDFTEAGDAIASNAPRQFEPGLVSHVRIVAILMIVQGVLELLIGGFYIVMGIIVATVMRDQFASEFVVPADTDAAVPPPEVFIWITCGTYVVMGLTNLIVGSLHGYAGYRNYSFKSRTLGVIALAGGMATLLGCYCLPTALALAVYGLIVYLNASVAEAFRMGEQGQPSATILARFSRF